MKILVAEDHSQTRELLINLLRKNGHEVLEAKYRNEATRLLKTIRDIGLVITDLYMPAMEDSNDLDPNAGIIIAHEVSRLPPPRPRVFLMSSTLDSETREGALRIGVEEAVDKGTGLRGIIRLLAEKDIVAII